MSTSINTTNHLQVIPSGAALGAEIKGLDLSQALAQDVVDAVHQALLDHCVLVFRDQDISEDHQVRFTNYFGKAVEHVRKQLERPVKEVFLVSNIQENGQAIGALSNAEISFHSDLSYLPEPGTLSLLYAREIPDEGGDTYWCDCYAAYDALSDTMKQQLDGVRAVHRHYVEDQNPETPASHPVACTHPNTGRKALYVGPHLTKYIEGVSADESDALLAQLYEHALHPEFIYAHRWHVDDLVVFDNRCTMHRRDPFPDNLRRVIWRTQIFNDIAPIP